MTNEDVILESFNNLSISKVAIFPIITVYYNTLDYPNIYVARLYDAVPRPTPTKFLVKALTLKEIRNKIPKNLLMLKRESNDDPNIIENYL